MMIMMVPRDLPALVTTTTTTKPHRRRIPPLLPQPVHRAGEAVHPGRQRALEALNRLRQRLQDRLLRLHVGAESEELVLLEAQGRFAHVKLRHCRRAVVGRGERGLLFV